MKVLLIISCSKQKLKNSAPARKFYIGRTFKQLTKLAQMQGFDWLLVSGKLGLVMPDEIIEPYDQKLKDSKEDIDRVRKLTIPKLVKLLPKYDKFIVFMGSTYRKIIEPLFDERFMVIHHPKGFFGHNSLLSSCLKLQNGKVLSKLSKFDINHPSTSQSGDIKLRPDLMRWLR